MIAIYWHCLLVICSTRLFWVEERQMTGVSMGKRGPTRLMVDFTGFYCVQRKTDDIHMMCQVTRFCASSSSFQ